MRHKQDGSWQDESWQDGSRLAGRVFCHWFCALALVVVGLANATDVFAVPSDYVVNYDQGYETGYPIGYEYGFDIGFERGTDEGTADGETEGYDDGWDSAYDPAYQTAYDLSLSVGKVAGFSDAFPIAAAEGYQWASEVHSILTNPINGLVFTNSFPDLTATLIDRWGNPNGWGSGSFSSIMITNNSLVFVTDWAEHYHDEGYDDGYDEGKTVGDQIGFDEAYPLAYEAAYEPAFDQGSKEGTFQGIIDGGKKGYDDGWTVGADVGESEGFLAGADYYVAGGRLVELDPTSFVAAYATRLGVSSAVPEPTSLCLGFLGLMLVSGRRSGQ